MSTASLKQKIQTLKDIHFDWFEEALDASFHKSDFGGSLRPLEYLFGAVCREFRPSIGSSIASRRLE